MFTQDTRGDQQRLLGIGDNMGLYADAWGRQKVVTDFSQFHGVFTFDVPDKLWIEYSEGVEVPKSNCISVNGALKIASGSGNTILMSKRHPRYQPNRGMLYSTAMFLDSATRSNGTLYAVTRTYIDDVVVEDRQQIDFDFIDTLKGYDPSKGNIYDIQAQWRGVGGYKFFINGAEVYHFDYLGALDELSINNPALPLSFEVDDTGIMRFGAFAPQFGMFFEWQFDSPIDFSLRCGCVDLTSEGGTDEKQQFVAAVSEEITVSDSPIMALRIPETFQNVMNTRDVQLSRIKVSTDKKGSVSVYTTRDTSCLTLTGIAWEQINGGNIEVLRPDAAAELTMDETRADLIDLIPVEAATNNVADNPNDNKIDFYLVHGDILILKGTGNIATMQAVVQMGEEL